MTDKALISTLSWRTLEMQKAAFPDMPYFTAPLEIASLLRPTTRKTPMHIWVLSLAVIADNEKDFRAFLSLVKSRKAYLHSKDECLAVSGQTMSIDKVVAVWKYARKSGAARIGGRLSAAKKEERYKSACDSIRDNWPKPSDDFPTNVLLEDAGESIGETRISYNTAIKYLGRRPIEQANYEAKMKRAKRRQEAGRV